MKPFVKMLIGGALGAGALYIVGKICYEAGRESAEIERQLQEGIKLKEETDRLFDIAKEDGVVSDSENTPDHHIDNVSEKSSDDVAEQHNKSNSFGRMFDKVKNAKMFLTVKKAFNHQDRKPGILGSLLTNPDGAKIEAIVKDGGVQISIKPRAA